MSDQPETIERAIRERCEAADFRGAVTVLVEGYGPEILGFLASRLRDPGSTDEVFSMFCEDVWRGLPAFGWRCRARAWAYTLARHAEARFRSAAHRRVGRNVPLSDSPEALALADRVRTTTLPHLRTDVKDKMRALRERLDDEEQVILVLHVDKALAFRDIAYVLRGTDLDDADATRESARIRKRFQLLKEKLRAWAEAEGVLASSDGSTG